LDKKITSKTVLDRLDLVKSKSKKAKESAENRWSQERSNANALPTQSERNAIKVKESKIKEIKIKENKVNEITRENFSSKSEEFRNLY
jgi:hypothetical protein